VERHRVVEREPGGPVGVESLDKTIALGRELVLESLMQNAHDNVSFEIPSD
jgi:hypothetical protein